MIKLKHQKKEEGIEFSIDEDNKAGIKFVVDEKKFKENIDGNLDRVLELVENYFNQNYKPIREKKSGTTVIQV